MEDFWKKKTNKLMWHARQSTGYARHVATLKSAVHIASAERAVQVMNRPRVMMYTSSRSTEARECDKTASVMFRLLLGWQEHSSYKLQYPCSEAVEQDVGHPRRH